MGTKQWKVPHFGNGWPSTAAAFDRHEHEKRGEGQVMVTVHREGRKAEVPLGGSHQILDARVVRRACEELGLDWSRLPGPEGRV
jgi:hypothetical protein